MRPQDNESLVNTSYLPTSKIIPIAIKIDHGKVIVQVYRCHITIIIT